MSTREAKTNRRAVRNIVRNPFGTWADTYRGEGWYPHPIPFKKKEAPVTGVTGNRSKLPQEIDALIAKWVAGSHAKGNIAIWLQPGIVGIDVDAYKDDGKASLKAIEKACGPLPDTWTSSARSDGLSGIRFYRVPEGLHWPGKIGNGIETVHSGHRYALVAPSVHPDGMCYLWYRPGAVPDGRGQTEPPPVHELPELDEEFIDYFTHHKFSSIINEKKFRSRAIGDKAIKDWIRVHNDVPSLCSEMLRRLDFWIEGLNAAGAHDTARDGTFNLVSLAAEGHAGIALALDRLHDAFVAEISDETRAGTARSRQGAEDEWWRCHDAAIKKTMARQENLEFEGAPDNCFCGRLKADGTPKPKLNVGAYSIADDLPGLYEAIAANARTDWYGVYFQSGSLVTLGPNGQQSCTVPSLRGTLARAVECYKPYGEESIPMPANPPRDLLETMLEDEYRAVHLPHLRGVADTPFWAYVEDEPTLFYENGYHASAGMFLDMDPELAKSVAGLQMDPEDVHVDRAIYWIEKMIGEFPFVGPGDKATAYAALILPFVRDLIDGPTPLHLFDAPRPGVGKSLLVDVIGMVACGALDGSHGFQSIGVREGRDRNVEMHKEMASRVKQGARVLSFDNVSGDLDSAELAHALTSSPDFTARQMGSNKVIQLPNRMLWAATGNNVQASPEIQRRIVSARLDTGTADPSRGRVFDAEKGDDLRGWVRKHRPQLVWSVLTLVANWVAAGQPAGVENMGSFESWARVIGGILATSGIDGLLTNEAAFRQRSAGAVQSLDGLVIEWADQIGSGFDVVSTASVLANLEASEDVVSPDSKDRPRKLGKHLRANMDNLIQGYYIKTRSKDGRDQWYLLRADGSQDRFVRRRKRAKKV